MTEDTWTHMDLRELEQEREFECWNCDSPTTEKGPCEVCGTEPFEGKGYRIECLECGAIEHGDRGQNAGHDMFMHWADGCSEAEFEVSAL